MLKKILAIVIIVLSFNLVAQTKKNSKKSYAAEKKSKQNSAADRKVFGDNDEDFKTTSVPEKWSKESAVVLCQKYDYSYVRSGMSNLLFTTVQRVRVKILDKSALEDYSKFFYRDGIGTGANVGFRIIKPDGSVKKVDLSDAIEVTYSLVPTIFRTNYTYKLNYKKIAIPNLVVGDIIDYYYTTENTYKQDGIFSFSPFIFRINKKYPIVKQKYFYNVDKGFKVSYRTFNGAPKMAEGKAGVNKYGKVKDHIKTYLLEDNDRDKYKSEWFKYTYLTDPTIKFQVSFIPRALVAKTELLVTDGSLVDKPIDLKEIQKRVPRQARNTPVNYSFVSSYIKKYHKDVTDPIKKTEIVYEYLRYSFYKSLFFGYYSSYSSDYEKGTELPTKHYVFTNAMIEILKKLKVDCEYVIAVDRHYGKFEDVLLVQELISGIKVKDRFFFYFTNYSSSDNIPSRILGAEAITFTPSLKYDNVPFKKTNILIPDYKYNNIKSKMDITINDDLTTININSKKTYKGATKTYFTSLALMNEDYFDADKKRFDPDYEKNNKTKIPKTKLSKNTKFKLAEKKRKEEAEKKEKLKKKLNALKEHYEDDYEISEYNSFKLESDGRFIDSPNLIVEENYDSESFINKAGRNYIFNIGALIGSQFELEKEDMTRESDIHLSFPKSYNYSIKIKLPAGYKASGLDQLSFNIDNAMGSFISNAKEVNGYVILETTKNYKVLDATKGDWKDFVVFLEAAYEFSQKKIILKKQ